MPDTIEKCQHSKDSICQSCAMSHERDTLIVKAINLSQDDPFASRVLRYLEMEKTLAESSVHRERAIQKEVRTMKRH